MAPFLLILAVMTSVSFAGETQLTGTYQIPVPSSISEAAKWNLKEMSWRSDANDTLVEYRLPNDITGTQSIVISLRGNRIGNQLALYGEAADANCFESQNDSVLTCLVKHKNLKIDFDQTLQYLEKTYSGEILERKRRLITILKDDPAGGVLILERK